MRSTPDLLADFAAFCATEATLENEQGPFADFEWLAAGEAEFLPELVGSAEKAAAFEPLGQNGAGCVIAFWRDPAQPESERPLVWLDSEGSPQAVVANSLAELLTLLPYDTVLLYNASVANEDHWRKPTRRKPPTEEFSTADVESLLIRSQQRNPSQRRYTRWLMKVAGLQVSADPMALIEQAYRSHTRLQDWISQ